MSGWHTLAGTILGFSATVVPEFVQMLKDHFAHDRQMELEVHTLTAAKDGFVPAEPPPAGPAADAFIAETDCQFITFIKASVRPVLTYLFFALFALVKLVSLYYAYHVEHLAIAQAMPTLWDDETETLFAAIVSFWFGSRALKGQTNGNPKSASLTKTDELSGSDTVIGE